MREEGRALRAWLKVRGSFPGPIFLSKQKRPINRTTLPSVDEEVRRRGRHTGAPPAFPRGEERFGTLHHLSESVHSKLNCRCSTTIRGSLRPHRTFCVCCCTGGNARCLRSITQGVPVATCLAGKMPSRISRFTTVSLTCSSRAASF